MEKQGIITGIGNEITPEIDAVINEYIVGKNTILKGLELNGNILRAGTCILCGYMGTLENSQTVDGNYVYGKFVIGVNETDSFSIITSSNSTEPTDGIINPTSITSAGTYYLRLYANGVSKVDSERYPKQADTSDRARDLIAGGTISSSATATTAPINDNSRKVANTEYVHNQIQEEINKGEVSFDLVGTDFAGGNKTYGTINIKRRAKYCIATLTFPQSITVYKGTLNLGNMPDGYIPNKTVLSSIGVYYYDNLKTGQIKLDNAITLVNIPYSSDNESIDYSRGYVSKGTYQIGYECQ